MCTSLSLACRLFKVSRIHAELNPHEALDDVLLEAETVDDEGGIVAEDEDEAREGDDVVLEGMYLEYYKLVRK